jgi:hypothetical protein
VTTVARPGVPLGSALAIPGRKRKGAARQERAAEAATATGEDEGGERPARARPAAHGDDDSAGADEGAATTEPASED